MKCKIQVKKTNFNNLIYYLNYEIGPKNVISFKGPLGCYKNIKDFYITLDKAEENQKEN